MFLLTHCQILKLKHLHHLVHYCPKQYLAFHLPHWKKKIKTDFVITSRTYNALCHFGKMWKKKRKVRLKFEENHPRFHTLVPSKALLTMFLCTFLGVPCGIPPVRLKLLWAFFVSPHVTRHAHFIAQRFHYFQMKDSPSWFCFVLCSNDISSPKCYCRTSHTQPEGSPESTTNCGPLHILKTEAVCFSKTLVPTYQTVRNNMNHHGRGTLKPYT